MKRNSTTKNTIKKVYVCSETTPEVDFEMYDDVLGKEDVEEAYKEWGPIVIDNSGYYYNIPMKIDDAIALLNRLKEKGSNYVSIEHNCDHPDYTFVGFDIHRATEEDIKEEKERETIKAIEEANKLRKQAEDLLEQANKINS